MTNVGKLLREAAARMDRGDYERTERLILEALDELTRTTRGYDLIHYDVISTDAGLTLRAVPSDL